MAEKPAPNLPSTRSPAADYSAGASTARPATPRKRRLLRFIAWLLIAVLVSLLAAGAGLWWWTGGNTSLAAALARGARYLPAEQQLESRDVTGSLRRGGHIGWLRWSSPSMAVEVTDLTLGWSLAPLLQRRLELGDVHAARVQITPQAPDPAAPKPPAQPPAELALPLRVGLAFRIDEIDWVGPPAVQARGLAGDYRFDGDAHRLRIASVEVAQGLYAAQATLQAYAPLALQASMEGTVQTQVPGGGTPQKVAANATVDGTLGSTAALLQLKARIAPEASNGTGAEPPAVTAGPRMATSPPMQADVEATIGPWAPQPLQAATATLQALNLAALWPQAPVTQLHGTVTAGPATGAAAAEAPGWSVRAALRNALPGPWDAQRLPVAEVQADARYQNDRWTVPAATLSIGAGTATLAGQYTPSTRAVEGRMELRNLSPGAVHSALDAAPLSGRVLAEMQDSAVQFNADIRASGAASPRPAAAARRDGARRAPARIQRLAAQGSWLPAPPSASPPGTAASRPASAGSMLRLQRLSVDAVQAQIEATNLQVGLGAAPSVRGQATLAVPGASARLSGTSAPRAGDGTLQVQWSDIESTRRWLTTLPLVGATVDKALRGATAQGSVSLEARWRGGWQTALEQVESAAAGRPAPTSSGTDAFDLQARLATPQLDLQLPSSEASASNRGTAVQVRTVAAQWSGSLAAATLALEGQALLHATQPERLQRLALQTRMAGGLAAPGQWRVAVNALQLQAQDAQRPGPWSLKLGESPLNLTVRTGSDVAIDASAGDARLTGPAPGTVLLRWQPLRVAAAGAGLQVQSQGTLEGLPMAWVDALGLGATAPASGRPAEPLLRRAGLATNILLNGEWNIDTTAPAPRVQATLRRASGDLRILAGDPTAVTAVRSSGQGKGAGAVTPIATEASSSPAGGTPAGVRTAEVSVVLDGETVRARLQWASERAGEIDATASTRLSRAAQDNPAALQWAPNAPLEGALRASLPDVGVWSALAPPGWRVRGTLQADATLSGTRDAPQWSGTLGADNLAVRSVVEGVDLQDGRLRAVLRGNQVELTELRLRGGRGSGARIVGFSGNRTAAPVDGGTLTASGTLRWGAAGAAAGAGLSGLSMNLQAEAKALQVLARADRQLSVSGQLRAQLEQGQITLRGALTADRATIILPDESTPRLGSDVVVRSAAKDREDAAKAQAAAKASQTAAVQAETAKPAEVAVTFNLGNDFALHGHGITTRLTGEVQVRSSGSAAPRVTGEVRTDAGRYRAWGQMLDVETGLIRFNGPYDNPSLDILALRPNISVRAGVQVTGSAQAPRVKLYSDPELPDAEKLSWVVLGRDAASGGAEAAVLQQAALALLGRGGKNNTAGNIASRVGLDEIGFKGPGSGEDATGAALTFGKRLSKDLYVTYERSLSGTLGTLYIFYDLTRRLTLRGQTGEKSAVDLIYTIKYD